MKNSLLRRYSCVISVFLLIIPFGLSAQQPLPAPQPAPQSPALNTPSYRIKTIVIDAGHGGAATGATGKYSQEKNVTLKVAMMLGKAIQDSLKDVRVIYTRTTDINTPFLERVDIANRNKADLFISIHCNSMGTARERAVTRGVETFVAGYARLGEQDVALRENADILFEKDYIDKYGGYDPKDPASIILLSLMKNTFRRQSIQLATFIQDEYIKTERVDRGVKEQSLIVLRTATMPAILTEIGFISQPEEEDYLNSENGQNEVVSCILRGIQAYKKHAEL